MNSLKLNAEQSFAIENLQKQVRLVIYNNGVENVCRKERIKNIERFIQPGENHLFKGRLQLYKDEAGISIQVKGKIVGTIKTADFINYLQKVKQ